MLVREATTGDIDHMSSVLLGSITDLCTADHKGNRADISRWTANKSPNGIRRWMEDQATHLYVACEGDDVLGVAAFNDAGEVLLNYVAPDARFTGVSKALLSRIERDMAGRGIEEAHLTSTVTANHFYKRAGWSDSGAPRPGFGASVQPMKKLLTSAQRPRP